MTMNVTLMKSNLLILIFSLIGCSICAQNTKVQTFDFGSQTRDTMIAFPDDPDVTYERIIMHYGMRCKNGFISTGADRNRGCGEWDYSCNTYIVDSTRVDSLKQFQPEYVVSGVSTEEGSVFQYSDSPTFSLLQRTEREVSVTSGASDLKPIVDSADIPISYFGQAAQSLSYSYILRADDMTAKGLTAGLISGLSFPITTSTTFEGLRINITPVSISEVNEGLPKDGWTEVYNATTELLPSSSKLVFSEAFNWNGTSNLAVNLSYGEVHPPMVSNASLGEKQNYLSTQYTASPYAAYTQFGPSANLIVPSGLETVTNEITVAFWQFGSEELPRNSTIFEGRDANNLRQVNVHLPWGNSQVYWDCGNDGTGYDRINKPALDIDYKRDWNHWAFTKNATTGDMKIYLNGTLWHSGTDKFKPIDLTDMAIGSGIINKANRCYSKMSDFRLLDKELSEEQVKAMMHDEMTSSSDLYSNLVLHYPLHEQSNGKMTDYSSNSNHALIEGAVNILEWRIGEAPLNTVQTDVLIEHALDQGNYTVSVNELIIRDTIPNQPHQVTRYSIKGTDEVIEESVETVYPAGEFPIYDEAGNVVDIIVAAADGEIEMKNLLYYSKHPMEFEIMSFVTPYGIGIDLGKEGKSWTFDVTDFSPILKGNKRMFMSRGGQWQEEMDIWFEFIEGTPDKDVLDIQQIWPVRSVGHARITDDFRFEPRLIYNDPLADKMIVKTTITGHQQGGEFEPRFHEMYMGIIADTWPITMECSDIPIAPQGGTWIYDRQGWCPGIPSLTHVHDWTDAINFYDDEAFLDYSVISPPGASNYIVNAQLVKYGPLNKDLDAELLDVINPTQKVEYNRYIPSCSAPTIVVRNNGKEKINEVLIKYGVVNRSEYWHRAGVSIESLEQVTIQLPFINEPLVPNDGDMFFASLSSVNNTEDAYPNNDSYVSAVMPVEHYEEDLILECRTNNFGGDTSYFIEDENGNVIFAKANLSGNTFYRDTIPGLNGCFSLRIEDAGDDGLAFWANNDGNGFFRVRSGTDLTVINPDFGSFTEHHFTAGFVSSTKEVTENSGFKIFPNPSEGKVYFSDLDQWKEQLSVSVMSQDGHRLFYKELNKTNLYEGIEDIDILPSGIYYLELADAERRSIKKLIKI